MLINRINFKNSDDFAKKGRGCATLKPNNYQIIRNDERLSGIRIDTNKVTTVKVNIQFIHIIDSNGQGKVTEETRGKQVSILNKAFSSGNIEFIYSPGTVKEVINDSWFYMDMGSMEERQAKLALHTTPERNLNFYTGAIAPGLLGWATFPWQLAGDRVMDGVVIQWETLPGGDLEPFNLGMTAVHEVGHWLGLYHTFQGGCDAFGDHIKDTVAHKEPNVGKPQNGLSNGACENGMEAPIHNYMNYCDDAWMTEFTSGQYDRIIKHVIMYRKELINK